MTGNNGPLATQSAGFAARSRGRAALGGAWLIAGTIVSAHAQSNGGYDPRSWTYDQDRSLLVSPAAPDEAPDEGPAPARSAMSRQVVDFNEPQPKGSIVIDTTQRRLYYVLGNGKALRYAVGVGRQGLEWSGRDTISSKRDWPDWRPPAEMRAREATRGRGLPARVPGGPNNPLGARALYIGNTLYRVHGTDQPWTVGQANSSGCIRMTNEDVIDLYDRVKIGAQIIVRH